MKNFNLKKYLAEGRLLREAGNQNEGYDKESLLKALGDADDAFIQLSDGRELLIYNPNSNNDDNANMWSNDTLFALDQDGQEEEVDYRDIAGIFTEGVIKENSTYVGDNLSKVLKITNHLENIRDVLWSGIENDPNFDWKQFSEGVDVMLSNMEMLLQEK